MLKKENTRKSENSNRLLTRERKMCMQLQQSGMHTYTVTLLLHSSETHKTAPSAPSFRKDTKL